VIVLGDALKLGANADVERDATSDDWSHAASMLLATLAARA
jgi:hypothetical protein